MLETLPRTLLNPTAQILKRAGVGYFVGSPPAFLHMINALNPTIRMIITIIQAALLRSAKLMTTWSICENAMLPALVATTLHSVIAGAKGQ